jgi:hypothetical protein
LQPCTACSRHGWWCQAALKDLTGVSTVPRVFIAGKCIGDGDETEAAARDGSLKKLLLDAGVNMSEIGGNPGSSKQPGGGHTKGGLPTM